MTRLEKASPHAVTVGSVVWFGLPNMYYVHILQSDADDGLYIGFSSDLKRRLAEHQCGRAFATSYRGPWKLIYYEAYLEEADALGRERYLKISVLLCAFGKRIREK